MSIIDSIHYFSAWCKANPVYFVAIVGVLGALAAYAGFYLICGLAFYVIGRVQGSGALDSGRN